MDEKTKAAYPARYYAATDKPGWFDTWDLSDLTYVPPANELLALTEAEWQQYSGTSKIGQNGQLVDFITPAAVLSMRDQASAALALARQHVTNTYALLNEATPDAWVAYLRALAAIANGTDTTSAALPEAPAS